MPCRTDNLRNTRHSGHLCTITTLEHLRVQKIYYMEVLGGHGAMQNRQSSKHTAQWSSLHNYNQFPLSAHAIIYILSVNSPIHTDVAIPW